MRHPITRLVVASHNEGKVREIRDLLKPFGVETFSARELNLPEPEETGTNFIQNAELKARAAADVSNMVALADDSGLAVDALDGAPGIYSARWAELPDGSGRDFKYAMAKVHEEIQKKHGVDTARFICALSLAFPNADVHSYEGKVEGRIIWPPRGDKGFGYDPFFQAIGDTQTFAEMEPADKHAKSHRADAFAKFIKAWFPHGPKSAEMK
ncbi:MAG: non-canonical purine NTP pyrophosphatase, RdgB/HAM1 family [Robiginitomaculum sp.]|nr:MAG: non-canonical purine NTP pyrophosphatase, RdgB/HAM1 family [Robiginitomaculum sp.]